MLLLKNIEGSNQTSQFFTVVRDKKAEFYNQKEGKHYE